MSKAELFINGAPVTYEVEGTIVTGDNAVALEADDDLIVRTSWAARGYAVLPFLAAELREALLAGATETVRRKIEEVTGSNPSGFRLEDYHRFVSDEAHFACVRGHALCRDASELAIDMGHIEAWASEALRIRVNSFHKAAQKRFFCIRIVRPLKPDNNPPHRDNYIDRLRNGVNAYIPLAGSDERSSLPLVPGSHRWKESDICRTSGTATVNGIPFSVPAIVSGPGGKPLEMIRPNPKAGEGMIFTPYAVHGGGINLNEDTTRVSLEIRFFRAEE